MVRKMEGVIFQLLLLNVIMSQCKGVTYYELCPSKTIPATSGGVLRTPGYGVDYPNDLSCNTTIEAPSGYKILFHPLAGQFGFDLEIADPQYCGGCCDWLQISDVSGDGGEVLLSEELCGTVPTILLKSQGNKVVLRFKSDSSYHGKGISLPFEVIVDPYYDVCKDTMTTVSRGSIVSPDWPSLPYPNNIDCQITIRVPSGQNILLASQVVDMETETDCSTCCTTDWLEILDVGGGILVDKLCSGGLSQQFKTNEVILKFYSDGTNKAVYRGFQIAYSAIILATSPQINSTIARSPPTGPPKTGTKPTSVNHGVVIPVSIVGGAVFLILISVILLVVRRKTKWCDLNILGNFLCCSVGPIVESPRPPVEAFMFSPKQRKYETVDDDYYDPYWRDPYDRSRTPSPGSDRKFPLYDIKEIDERSSASYTDRDSYQEAAPAPPIVVTPPDEDEITTVADDLKPRDHDGGKMPAIPVIVVAPATPIPTRAHERAEKCDNDADIDNDDNNGKIEDEDVKTVMSLEENFNEEYKRIEAETFQNRTRTSSDSGDSPTNFDYEHINRDAHSLSHSGSNTYTELTEKEQDVQEEIKKKTKKKKDSKKEQSKIETLNGVVNDSFVGDIRDRIFGDTASSVYDIPSPRPKESENSSLASKGSGASDTENTGNDKDQDINRNIKDNDSYDQVEAHALSTSIKNAHHSKVSTEGDEVNIGYLSDSSV